MESLSTFFRNGSKTKYALVCWFAFLSVAAFAYFWLLPLRSDFNSVSASPRFWMETLAWLPASFMAAWLAFRKQPSITSPVILKMLPFFAPFLLVLLRIHTREEAVFAQFSDGDFSREMDLFRGRCGFIILATGVLTSVIGFSLIRKIVFSNEVEIGASALVSSGCFASFLMQFVCAHENPLHLFIWHFMPLVLLGVVALYLEKRFVPAPSVKTRRIRRPLGMLGQFML